MNGNFRNFVLGFVMAAIVFCCLCAIVAAAYVINDWRTDAINAAMAQAEYNARVTALQECIGSSRADITVTYDGESIDTEIHCR